MISSFLFLWEHAQKLRRINELVNNRVPDSRQRSGFVESRSFDLEQAALIDMRNIKIYIMVENNSAESREMLSKFKLLTSEANRKKLKTFVTVVTTRPVVCVEVTSSLFSHEATRPEKCFIVYFHVQKVT